jgi:hypothetical protein
MTDDIRAERGAPETVALARRGRRAFLRASLAHLALLTAAAGRGRTAHAAQDGLLARRHLITIQPTGPSGYDAHSFHMGLRPASLSRANLRSQTLGNLPAEMEVGPRDWTPRDVDGASGFVHPNYADEPDVYLGPGMSIFQDTPLLRETIQIVGGLGWLDGGHTIGVEVMNAGRRAKSAVGFSSLIARSLGAQRPLPLHYVQLAEPAAIPTHLGLLGGRAEPVVIPDPETLGLITQMNPKNDVPLHRRDAVNEAVQGLVSAALGSRLELKASRELYTDYASSFQRALSIMSSDMSAPGSEFSRLWTSYADDVAKVVEKHAFWTRALNAKGKPPVDLRTLSFRFALAEYLVATDTSGIIDIGVPFQDAHADNAREAAILLAIYACYRRLLLNLRARSVVVAGEQRGLLDVTTVAMFSEFDRAACLSDRGREAPGTGHGAAASMLLAGMGCQGGTVIGAIKLGPEQGPLPSLKRPIGAELPIRRETGRPDLNGKPYLLENVFPTIMSLFDTTIPSNQRSVHSPIQLKVRS